MCHSSPPRRSAKPATGGCIPLLANGQLAAAAYHLGNDGYRPFAIVVLATTLTHLSRIVLFAEPGLFDRFDLPAIIAAGQ